MSFYYYKVPKQEKEAKVYGNKKVEKNELNEITERVTRPTYSTILQQREQTSVHNYVNVREKGKRQTLTSCRKRVMSAPTLDRSKFSRKFTDREFGRMIRRLRKPTMSFNYSRSDFDPDSAETSVTLQNLGKPRPKTAEERSKTLNDLCRPTTASNCKVFDRMKYMGENYNKYDYDCVYGPTAPPEEIEFIVDRMSRTTIARSAGKSKCARAPLVTSVTENELYKHLPLISGLKKSRTVEEIVDRLYQPSRNSGFSRSNSTSNGV